MAFSVFFEVSKSRKKKKKKCQELAVLICVCFEKEEELVPGKLFANLRFNFYMLLCTLYVGHKVQDYLDCSDCCKSNSN